MTGEVFYVEREVGEGVVDHDRVKALPDIGSLDVAADEADAGSGIFPLRKLYHLRRDVDARDIRAAPDVIRYQNSGAAGHVENAAALSDSGVVEDDVYLPVAAYQSRVPAWGAAVKEFYYVGFIYHGALRITRRRTRCRSSGSRRSWRGRRISRRQAPCRGTRR